MSAIDFNALCTPFPYAKLRWRVTKTSEDRKRGLVLPYLDAREVQERLDEVLTPAGWRVSYAPVLVGGGFLCTLELLTGEREWVGKSDFGRYDGVLGRGNRSARAAAETNDREVSALSEQAIKGGASDAFKRAAVMWGIGRYLYQFEPIWVPLTEGRRLVSYPPVPDTLLIESERGQEPWKALQTALEAGASGARAGVALPRAPQPQRLQSSASGDMQDPSLSGSRQGSSARPTVSLDRAPIGTEEQRQALTDEDRRAIAVLADRLHTGTELKAVEDFLNGPRGEALPDWARQILLEKLASVHEGLRAAA